MMLRHTNIDRTDASLNTNAPFQFGCPLHLGQLDLVPGLFLSVKLYLTEDLKAPAHLAEVELQGTGIFVRFTDARGRSIGTWRVYNSVDSAAAYVSDFVYNDNSIIVGHITADKSLVGLMRSAAMLAGGRLTTPADDFKLLPACCVPWYSPVAGAISVNGELSTGDVTIDVGTRVLCFEDDGTIVLDTLGPLGTSVITITETLSEVGDRYIQRVRASTGAEFGATCRHVCLKAGVTSNLRVEGTDSIKLSGVLDEQ